MTNFNNINSPISREERNKLNENWQLLTQRFNFFQRHLNLLAGEDVEGVITNINERIADTDAALQQIETDLAKVNGAADNANIKAELAQTAAEIAEQITELAQEKVEFIEGHQEDIVFFTSMQNNLQAQVNQLVVNGDSSPEAAQARVGSDGTEHTTLKTRLDADNGKVATQFAQTKKFSGQADFVEFIKNRTQYSKMIVKKINTPYEALQVFCHDGNEHVTHEWKKNNNDDFWIYNVAFGGKLTTSPEYLKSTTSKIGTWSVMDGSGNVYTTEVGAKFTVMINGSTLQLNHMADRRGGKFRIVIDGDEENAIEVSTFSDTTVVKNTIIATGLVNKLHTVVGTFMGADPDNPPSETARGWIRDDQTNPTSTDRYTMVGGTPFNGIYSSSVNKMLLGYASNKEGAFNLTIDGETHWLPEHNGQGTAFKKNEPILTVDNQEIKFADMEYGKLYNCVNMRFTQELNCVFPNITQPLANWLISYDIGLDGVLAIAGKLTFEQNVRVNNGYSLMLPFAWTANNYVLNELVTSIGNSHKSLGDNSNTNFVEESDQTISFCSIGENNKDYVAAMTIDYPNKTYRFNKPGRGNPFIFFHNRPAYPKLYPLTIFDHNATAGEVYQFYGRFAVGKVKRAYDLLK